MIRAAFGCRSVVGRNAYHLGHVEPILAKSADGYGPKCGDAPCTLDLPRRSVFDLSVSAGPGDSEQAGGREKTKTGKQGPGGGPGAPRALRPSAKVG